MRFMILMKASAESEAGVLPSTELLAAMGAFNAELVDAGVLLAGEGLQSSAKGARVRFESGNANVTKGPFTLSGGLIAGFWVWRLPALEDAIAWVKRCPVPPGSVTEIEIRQIFEADDFGEALTPELRENEAKLRARAEGRDADGQ